MTAAPASTSTRAPTAEPGAAVVSTRAALASALYVGRVQHRRHTPRAHAFAYRMFQPLLDLAELDRVFAGRWLWSVERRNLASFRRRDFHGDPAQPLDACVRDSVERVLGRRPDGPIRLLAHIRYFGHAFNPVAFYYGYLSDGTTLDWILAEITNTPWNERHAYLLPVETAARLHGMLSWEFDKVFHVSPFIPMQRTYRWRFSEPGHSLRVHMDVFDNGAREFDATLTLSRRPISGAQLARALLRFPLMSTKVVAAIYWQALRLWLKRVPFHAHPETAASSSVSVVASAAAAPTPTASTTRSTTRTPSSSTSQHGHHAP